MIEKVQSTETNTKVNQMLGLSSKDFKAAIIKMLPQTTINSLEINGKKKIKILAKIKLYKEVSTN